MVARVFATLGELPGFRIAEAGEFTRRAFANGRLDLGGYDYYLGVTWRNQMLELRFDTNQGCFLEEPAGSETTITIAPQGGRKPT